ncbi:thiamine phosphate synthase [Cellvibrio japonicus]|nr:thiamine phosphate synthase [Cellvibrio japonicus]QEI11530.1 thiamine phosphate synthase [Cellvibrio japonicus]QEI15104.1 thiamine phosphate synthase [Cellvibrio japonicus]QEI18684.1 thiamine phosphate synthase [Cellvibrio japonicus]
MNSTLYAITDSGLLPGERLALGVEAALQGGCRWIQYRDKSTDNHRRELEARQLVSLCNQYQAKLIINDDMQLAQRVNAHGVHLGQDDGNPAEARRSLGESAIIGVTCHDSLALAEKAIQDGASYIAFGRFFPSKTKPHARPAKFTLISEAKAKFPQVTLVVIGGITLDNAAVLLDAGADKLAVCHDLFAAADIAAQAQRFNHL